MASKQVAERVQGAAVVQASAAGIGVAAEALSKQLSKPELAKLVPVLVEALSANLAAKAGAMTAADDKLVALGSDDEPLREKRDEAAAKLRGVLVDLRDAITSGLRLKPSAVGLDGLTPEQPDDLLRAGQAVEATLTSSDPSKSATRAVRGFSFDRAAWLADVKGANKALSSALAAVVADTKSDQQARANAHRAMDEFDAALSATANVTSAILDAAGFAELASKVRPSRRNPGRLADTDDAPTGPAPTA